MARASNSAGRALGQGNATLLALWLTIVAVRASDQVPVQVPANDDSLAAARQQLDTLKIDATSRAVGTQPSALPAVSVPQFTPGASEAPMVTATATSDVATPDSRKSANWLVDGVMNAPKRADNTDRDRRGRKTRTTDSDRSLLGHFGDAEHKDGLADSTDMKTEDRKDATNAEKSAAKDTFDPLAQYMASWLAPKDYTLLRSTIETNGRSPTEGTASAGAVSVMPDGVSIGDATGMDFSSSPTDRSPPKAAENPYLQFVSPPEMPALPPSQTFAAPSVTPASSAPPDLTPAPPRPPAIPDFVRPLNDDKYFKPLKRF